MKKQLKPVELFLALGLAVTVSACSPNEGGEGGEGDVGGEVIKSTETMTEGVEGGEGGEGGEGASSGNPDVDYMTSLALMQGHLMVAEDLIVAGDYEAATPHIEHPIDELYGQVEGELGERNAPEFEAELTQLKDYAKASLGKAQLQTSVDEAQAAIDTAISALPEEQRQSPEFVLDVIISMLDTAASEYKAAIADGKFVEAIEYQDARGFVYYADELYQNVADTYQQENPEGHTEVSSSLEELKSAFPEISPPETPVKTPEEFYSLVAEVRLKN